MENAFIWVFAIAAGLLGLVLRTFSRYELEAFFFNKIIRWNPFGKDDYFRWEALFEEHFTYFRPLSLNGRAKFIGRAVRFSKGHSFRGMHGMKITPETELLISGAAVQLTFGLKNWNLAHLKSILVFPQPFFNRPTGQWFKGAVTEKGHLALSYSDFMEGYATPDDNYNLGLHEMAHLLKLDAKYEREGLFSDRLQKWFKAAKPKVMAMLEGKATFLREYAAENPQEFFAVCIEHFFESPASFRERLPHLYLNTCLLLGQDPLNPEGDYKLTRERIREMKHSLADAMSTETH